MQDDIRLMFSRENKGVIWVGHARGLVAEALEEGLHAIQDIWLIIHDEDVAHNRQSGPKGKSPVARGWRPQSQRPA